MNTVTDGFIVGQLGVGVNLTKTGDSAWVGGRDERCNAILIA